MNPLFDSAWNTYVKGSMPIIAAAIGALGGGIVSGFLVHILTQSRERERWILDCRKQEYRELLSALSQAHMSTTEKSPGYANTIPALQMHASTTQAQNDSLRIFRDRIYIRKELPLTDLQELWRVAMKEYAYGNATKEIGPNEVAFLDEVDLKRGFESEFIRISDEIAAAANRAVPKSAWQRLQFWKD